MLLWVFLYYKSHKVIKKKEIYSRKHPITVKLATHPHTSIYKDFTNSGPSQIPGSELGPFLFTVCVPLVVRLSATMGWASTAILMIHSCISAPNPLVSSLLCLSLSPWMPSKSGCNPALSYWKTIQLNSCVKSRLLKGADLHLNMGKGH